MSKWKEYVTILGVVALMLTLWALPSFAQGSSSNQAQAQVVLDYPSEQVLQAAPEAFQVWSRGELVTADPEKGQVKGLSRTRFFKFVDDITVSIQPQDPTHTLVAVESVGRMGEYDFGGNQRNIDEYLAALGSLLQG